MSTPYRTLLPEPKAKPKALCAPLSTLEAMVRVGNALMAYYREMELIHARASFAHNERMFERKMARIKKKRI